MSSFGLCRYMVNVITFGVSKSDHSLYQGFGQACLVSLLLSTFGLSYHHVITFGISKSFHIKDLDKFILIHCYCPKICFFRIILKLFYVSRNVANDKSRSTQMKIKCLFFKRISSIDDVTPFEGEGESRIL
jgi:hypothetical protein